ncbi:MAG: hypothetical protein AUI10_07155 [Actinobacteria bacterium 13_2_20CM_2_72_6]|nr:MAG: hypothetical protein AUI10_07155 [Actinobacteria bacterium 13_2_20CM_2_72_6]
MQRRANAGARSVPTKHTPGGGIDTTAAAIRCSSSIASIRSGDQSGHGVSAYVPSPAARASAR